MLSNSPEFPKSHWGRTVLPLGKGLEVVKGTNVSVKFSCIPAGPNLCENKWSVNMQGEDPVHYSGRQGCIASPGFH